MKYLSQFLHQTQPDILHKATRMSFLYTDSILTSAWWDLAKDAQNPIRCCSLFTNQHVRSQQFNQNRDSLKSRIFFHDTFPAKTYFHFQRYVFNSLNAQLNPICHLLALLGAHHILRVSRIRVNTISAGHADDPWCYIAQMIGRFYILFWYRRQNQVSTMAARKLWNYWPLPHSINFFCTFFQSLKIIANVTLCTAGCVSA
jgi:hypothetical protein